MTRAERLMFLVNLIKSRGRMLVGEMASECGVSKRSIFRDMNSLRKLNFPLYYDKGYRLSRDIVMPFTGLGAEDIELICYCLRNNPLSTDPFFMQKFRTIEQSMQTGLKQRLGTDQGCLFLFEKKHDPIKRSHEAEIIARFLRSIDECRMIYFTLVKGDAPNQLIIPLAVRLTPAGPSLIAATKAELLVEESVQNIAHVRVTDVKFTKRPLHLLRPFLPPQKKVDDV